MKNGQVARQSRVNTQTLRYYERRGLLPVPPRRPSGYREYTSQAVAVVRFVKRAQELGFSLDEFESLLELAAGAPPKCDRARGLCRRKLAEMDGRISRLRAMQGSLRRLVGTYEKPRHQRECPLLDALVDGYRAAARVSTMSPRGHAVPGHPVETRIEVLRTPGCRHVDEARSLLRTCLAELRLELSIHEREGDYPSPTILVNGIDVMGRTDIQGAMCRLDLPTRERMLGCIDEMNESPRRRLTSVIWLTH